MSSLYESVGSTKHRQRTVKFPIAHMNLVALRLFRSSQVDGAVLTWHYNFTF